MNKNNQNDFENQGWHAMLQTLDREMPVKKKRRVFLWLVFFIGLTAALGGGFWYSNTYNPVKTLDKTMSKPIVDVQVSKNTEGGRIIDFNQENKNNNIKVEQNNTNRLNLNKINKTAQNNIVQNNDNDLVVIENKLTIDNRNDINSIKLLNKIKIASLSIKQDSSELKYVYSYLHPFVCLAVNTAIINNKILVSKTRFGITTGIHTEKGQKIDGFQTGLAVSKLLNRHWSLGAGLNFRQTQTIGDSISYFRKEYLASATSSSNLQSGKPISLDKLYYLELPLTIQYHFKKKFAFSTGLKTSYLVGQSVKENGTSVYFVKSSFTSQNSYDLLNKVNTKTLRLNRWDISLMGGFSYLPTKNIQLGLRYDLGLTNIINRTNWSAYNRYLGLHVVYLF